MIKAIIKAEGKQMLLIGLSFRNLEKFLAKPGDTYIRIRAEELGLPLDVMIISGKTEEHLHDQIKHGIGPETIVHVTDRAKN
jgi:hypothetical protein